MENMEHSNINTKDNAQDVLKNNHAVALLLDDGDEVSTHIELAIQKDISNILTSKDEDFMIVGGKEGEGSIIIMFFEESKINDMVNIAVKHDIFREKIDIFNEALNFEFSNKRVAEVMEMSKDDVAYVNFYKKNVDMEIVLEKIFKGGMESLNSVDRAFLDNQ